MRLAIAITTCDRSQFGKANYWPRMWASMEKSGFRQQLEPEDRFGIFDAGPLNDEWLGHMPRAQTALFPGPRQSTLDLVRNTHRAMAWGVGTGADYTILLEDDYLCCKNWLAEVRQWLGKVPRAATYALCPRYPWSRKPENLARRWALYPFEHFYCARCVHPREFLHSYLLSELRQRREAHDVGMDFAVRDHAANTGLPIIAHCPDLMQHIGEESVCGHTHKPGPHDLMFPGEEFDATGPPEGLETDKEIMRRWAEIERSAS